MTLPLGLVLVLVLVLSGYRENGRPQKRAAFRFPETAREGATNGGRGGRGKGCP